ncbi:hypothetical protein GCM10020000_69790 [Streptomyces olivoverticillatus]
MVAGTRGAAAARRRAQGQIGQRLGGADLPAYAGKGVDVDDHRCAARVQHVDAVDVEGEDLAHPAYQVEQAHGQVAGVQRTGRLVRYGRGQLRAAQAREDVAVDHPELVVPAVVGREVLDDHRLVRPLPGQRPQLRAVTDAGHQVVAAAVAALDHDGEDSTLGVSGAGGHGEVGERGLGAGGGKGQPGGQRASGHGGAVLAELGGGGRVQHGRAVFLQVPGVGEGAWRPRLEQVDVGERGGIRQAGRLVRVQRRNLVLRPQQGGRPGQERMAGIRCEQADPHAPPPTVTGAAGRPPGVRPSAPARRSTAQATLVTASGT